MEGTAFMTSNTINQTPATSLAQPAASKLPPKAAAAETASAPVKKDTLEISDAAQNLKAADAAKLAKTTAALKLAKNTAAVKAAKALAALKALKAGQAAKDLVVSSAKKAAQEEATEAPSEKVQEKGTL
jgi:hypothetical protein